MTNPQNPPEPKSPTIDAEAALARAESALASHTSKVEAQRTKWHAADSRALASESPKDFRAAREAAEELADLERLTPKRQEDVDQAREALRAAHLQDAKDSGSIQARALALLDGQTQLDMAEDLRRWGVKFLQVAEAHRAMEDAFQHVEELGGPRPRADFHLDTPGLLAWLPASRGEVPKVDTATTLASLAHFVQDKPRRAVEDKAAAEEQQRRVAAEHEKACLRGELGPAEKEQALARQREAVRAFYGRSAVSNLFSGLPTNPSAATEG